MSPESARLIIEIHEIDKVLADAEEVAMLEEHNSELLAAYRELEALADSEEDYGDSSV